MREFKFRAWGGSQRKYFVYFSLEEVTEDYFEDITLQNDGSHNIIEKSDVDAIQQFTGLLDRNGKKIYEGDIVKHHTISGEWIGVVEYHGWCFTQLTFIENIEVIGNIYENPELLEIKV